MESYTNPEFLIIGILGLGFALGWFVSALTDLVDEIRIRHSVERNIKHEKRKEEKQIPKM